MSKDRVRGIDVSWPPLPEDGEEEQRGRQLIDADIVNGDFTGPIEPSYLVASVDARSDIRAVADYTCDGTGDETEIQAALTAIGTGKGRVVMSGGEFSLSDDTTITVRSGVTLQGIGTPSTRFIPEGDVTFDVYGLMAEILVSDDSSGCG